MDSALRAAFIVDAVRTPIGRYAGALAGVRPDDLGALVIAELVRRTGVDPDAIDDVIFGCANQAGEDNRNVARMSALLAGLPVGVPGLTVNRLCGSGLAAVIDAARAVAVGEADLIIAGGVESMSRAPLVMAKAGEPWARGNVTAYDSTLGWRFVNPRMEALYGAHPLGETAELVAEMHQVAREDQDAFALESQRRWATAQASGRFAREVCPVEIADRKGGGKKKPGGETATMTAAAAAASAAASAASGSGSASLSATAMPRMAAENTFAVDEHPRPHTTADELAALRPAFRKSGGTVTAGNSSGINDGAAALLIASEAGLRRLALAIVSSGSVAAAPGLGAASSGHEASHEASPAVRGGREAGGASRGDSGGGTRTSAGPLARVVASAVAGVEPRLMGLGPVPATRKLLARAGLRAGDLDIVELNEAFAAQAIPCLRELDLDPTRVNVNGGAIALGHPLGCSGARLAGTLAHELALRGGGARYGLATMCIGVGQGISLLLERAT